MSGGQRRRGLPTGIRRRGATYEWVIEGPPVLEQVRDPVTGEVRTRRRRTQVTQGGYRTVREAVEARAAALAQQGRGANLRGGQQPVRQAVEDWIASRRRLRPSSSYRYRQLLERLIAPTLGELPLRDLTPVILDRWIADLVRRGLSASTIAAAHQLLSSTLRRAVEHGDLARNPARLVQLPAPQPARPRRAWTHAELERALATPDEHALLWQVMLYSALRPGELLALRWPEVDLASGRLTVAATRTSDASGRAVRGEAPKTQAGRRVVSVPAHVAEALRQHRRRQLEARLKRPWAFQDQGFVFPNARGGMLGQATLGQRLARWCERAGVPRLTPHELRHTAISWMIRAGVNPLVIAYRAGHAKRGAILSALYGGQLPEVTGHYGHVSADDEAAAVALLLATLAEDCRRVSVA